MGRESCLTVVGHLKAFQDSLHLALIPAQVTCAAGLS